MKAIHPLSPVVLLFVGLQLCGCGTFYEGATLAPKAPIERAVFDELGSLSSLGVRPLSFDSVKFAKSGSELSEEQAFAGKDSSKRASWEADKKAMVAGFAEAMGPRAGEIQLVPMVEAEAPSDMEYMLEPSVTMVDPGFFASLVIQSPSFALVKFRIVRVSDGATVYQWDQTAFAASAYASGTRMRAIASSVGMDAFRMIRSFQNAEYSGAQPRRGG